jgi:hypothetical protein
MADRPRARSTGVLTEQVGDELVVYDSVSRSAHCLSADAASVWSLCDGERSPAGIAGELGMAGERVDTALRELGDAGLLESVFRQQQGISRRDAAKRLATIGAAAVSAPLIYSVVIPAAAAAMSGTSGPTDLCAGKNCDDHNACTIDGCNPLNGQCTHTPVVCDDNNLCTIDTCDVTKGCVFTRVANGTPCQDGTCQGGVCVKTP